ncbi:RIBOSOME BINDING PROTEIN-1, putative [Babesia bigemina]|uniref:RIBOSOME BINDING PROTEIN-1, putative n=1 Tax=Babesia bigemina TaxID=5866 RepID=A0A061D6F6_BABBI|nr:RIBOSOME BINDING PROTEIN-1, putative [Babesia bigemina]CDR96138.1 RIBOSOME BINDING PROTEIN-1, putative [Babesia bigemina]|eukprot:XP_012768324.1 RIBOSOME BINDING PROTEIN-1, putative [Babesia bigemina]
MTQIPLDTLKQCLQFLEWLHKGSRMRGSMRSRVASQLAGHASNYYNQVVYTGDLPPTVSDFLTKVNKFYAKLCNKAIAGSYETATLAEVVNALLECIPKVLAALYFLRYNVDKKFKVLGGGGWAGNNPGIDGNRYVWRWFKSDNWGGATQRYLRATKQDREFGIPTGVVPGGFEKNDLKEGWNYYSHEGYYYSENMIDDIKAILSKNGRNDYRNIFVTSIISAAGTDIANTANAVGLLVLFCSIVLKGVTHDGGEMKRKLEEDLTDNNNKKCIDWNKLTSHCRMLKSQLEGFFSDDAFSYTGEAPSIESENETKFMKETAKWFRGKLSHVVRNVNRISRDYPDVRRSNFSPINSFAANNMFPYGFIFGEKNYGTFFDGLNTLSQKWKRVIDMINTNKSLEKLKTLLEGEGCPKFEARKLNDTNASTTNSAFTKHVASETDAPHPTVNKAGESSPQAKKAEGAQNQGKKAEGAQNQGKKAEGAQNQGKKSEGAQNQGKKAEGAQNQGKKPEGAQNQGKKAEGAQNQGKKAEGAQNQGKKAEGAQNQGKKSEGAQNQGKKAEGAQNQGKKPEGAQNQGKKAEGAQNQGKKSEGAQNQGKKAEGAQNQGKKSEGAQNQGKKAEGGQNQGTEVKPDPNGTEAKSEQEPGSHQNVRVSDSQKPGAPNEVGSAVPPPPAPPSSVPAPRESAGTPDGGTPGSPGINNSSTHTGGSKVIATPQSPSRTGAGSNRSGGSRTGSDEGKGDQASASDADAVSSQGNTTTKGTDTTTSNDLGTGLSVGFKNGGSGSTGVQGSDQRSANSPNPDDKCPRSRGYRQIRLGPNSGTYCVRDDDYKRQEEINNKWYEKVKKSEDAAKRRKQDEEEKRKLQKDAHEKLQNKWHQDFIFSGGVDVYGYPLKHNPDAPLQPVFVELGGLPIMDPIKETQSNYPEAPSMIHFQQPPLADHNFPHPPVPIQHLINIPTEGALSTDKYSIHSFPTDKSGISPVKDEKRKFRESFVPTDFLDPLPPINLEVVEAYTPIKADTPPDLFIEVAKRPFADPVSVNDLDLDAPYAKTYDILRDRYQELGHATGEIKSFSDVPRTNFHLDFVQGLPGLEGYEDPGMPRDSPRQVAEHNVPLVPDTSFIQRTLELSAPHVDIDVANKWSTDTDSKPKDISLEIQHVDPLESLGLPPILPTVLVERADRSTIQNESDLPFEVSIHVPDRAVQDALHDVDLYYDHYANADSILRNEIKNAESWYGEDKDFSGLPKSNFNLDFTPAFFEYNGHQDPGIPRDPSRQVSARDLPLFPDPTQCLNPWYVDPSSKSSTFSPAPNSDHLPPPQTIRGMLFWIVGLTEYGYIERITEHVVCILEDINNASSVYQFPDSLDIAALTTSLVTKTLTDSCHFAANFLYRFKHKDVSDAFKSFFKNQDNNGFYYSPDPACLLCQLRDYVYAAHHQLQFLKAQCNRDKSHGGWQDCKYGSDITSPNSPLQAFLTDGCYSDFDTYLFDPGNICLKSRVKMGFRYEGLPDESHDGSYLSTILSPTCGGDDPLLTLSSYLNCLTRRTPRTTGELVSFFHHFGNELHLSYSKGPSNLGTALSTPHDCCPNWDHLGRPDLDAVRDFRGCQSPSSGNCHPNTLFTLLGCHIGNVHCHRHLSPITYRAYALYSPIFSHTYLSWTVYLTDRLWESLDKLLYDLDRLQCSNVRANHHCADALPLLYYHGFTPPEGMPASAVKCSDVIAKLEEVVNGDAVAKLVTCMDSFLYRIRMPFIILGFALWSAAFCLLVHAILYRRDMLRIRSHIMRCKVSHAIDVKVLLSLSRNMISLYDIEYFDDDDELTEASNTLFQ